MYRHLSGVVEGLLTAAVIATGLVLVLHQSPATQPTVAGQATAQSAANTSAAEIASDLTDWCRNYTRGDQTLAASLERRLSGGGGSDGADSSFVYVTVI